MNEDKSERTLVWCQCHGHIVVVDVEKFKDHPDWNSVDLTIFEPVRHRKDQYKLGPFGRIREAFRVLRKGERYLEWASLTTDDARKVGETLIAAADDN